MALYNIDIDNFYSQGDKYKMSRFMRYDSENELYDIIDSALIKIIPSLPNYGTKTVTIEEGKPSLLCENIYGFFNYQYWWIIMELNDLVAPEDIKTGMKIKYPFLSDLDNVFAILNPRNN